MRSSGMQVRTAAVQVLLGVIAERRSLSDVLPRILSRLAKPEDGGLLQELAYGTLRWRWRLEALAALLLERPLKQRDKDLQLLLLLGLYQLMFMKLPPAAAVNATVEAVQDLDKQWARGLLNAVLRRFLRERDKLTSEVDLVIEARLAHPGWLLDRLRSDWPGAWERLAVANNQRPPMVLRVNRQRSNRDEYLAELQAHGMEARPLRHALDGLVLTTPVDVTRLPGFSEGKVSVQDGAAQLAAPLLQLHPDQRVLDACSAPGGKACHMLELCPELSRLVALDADPARLDRLGASLRRLGLKAELKQGDARDPSGWWDQEPFDRILLDPPCSATGVIRRHPDIKTLRQPQDSTNFAIQQADMLQALWPTLRAGGILLYATCSVLGEENASQIEQFIKAHPDARAIPLHVGWGRETGVGRQILTGEDDMDGFFYAAVEKLP